MHYCRVAHVRDSCLRKPPASHAYVPAGAPSIAPTGGSISGATLEKRIYLGNLSPGMTDGDLKALASLIGAPEKVFLIRDGKGNMRGTAYIQFSVRQLASIPSALCHSPAASRSTHYEPLFSAPSHTRVLPYTLPPHRILASRSALLRFCTIRSLVERILKLGGSTTWVRSVQG